LEPAPAGLFDEKVFEDEPAFAPLKRAAAAQATYLAISRCRLGFDFHEIVQHTAVRTVERDWLGFRHVASVWRTPTTFKPVCRAIVTKSGTMEAST